jgi:hypothetical protein
VIVAIRDYDGRWPCIDPMPLGRVLDRLTPIKPRLRTERIDWQYIDRAAKRLQEASK